MPESLAVKYRPREFSEVCGQSSIIRILERQCELQKYKHTYLFTGPSGCGKTTIARILASKINGSLSGLEEMDAASNNGVDNVRAIIKSAQERSVSSKYKIFILDECVTGDTEILTDEGFKRIDSLTRKERIAQYTDDGHIEFVFPSDYVEMFYEGDMYEVSLRKNGKKKVMMSPHHVQPLRIKGSHNIKESYIKDCVFAQSNELITAGLGVGYNEALTAKEQLFIAAQADGYCNKNMLHDGTHDWEFHLKKRTKISRLLEILQELNITPRIYGDIDSGEAVSIRCHLDIPTSKLFTDFFSLDMGVDRARDFISEILKWDGSTKSGYPGYYSSVVKENVDFVSAVLSLAGYGGSQGSYTYTNPNHKPCHYVHWYNTDCRPTASIRKNIVQYSGMIYCVKVPSKKIVIRAEGFTFITGNCHALTNAAWQAFLKCIEEPPEFTIFIFCTTDPQKVPSTIVNRCQRYNLSKISTDTLIDRLTYICKEEGFTNYEESVEYIAKVSDGGARDAVATLEKVSSLSTNISIENTLEALGTYSYSLFFKLVNDIIDSNQAEVMKIVSDIYYKGNDLKLFVDQFFNFCLDITKYCLFKDTELIEIPRSQEENLKNSTNFDDASKYYMYIVDNLLELKSKIKNDTSIRTTVEATFLHISRWE